ncbi:hypothetical protein [Streptomyces sp. HUAS ZL42]|uniref:hypothetical protein n=1 Tax=Streptomyces sp. HUAS ZL42 TaxID=3231715 RepID=UPI00345E5A7A
MRKRMLRSMLVAAVSAVVAFGTLAGLSGAKSDVHKVGGEQSVTVAADGDGTPVIPLDTRWD